MNLLTGETNNIRYKSDRGVILYNPTTEQFNKIKNILRENVGIKGKEYVIDPEITVICMKYIYVNLTNVGEEARDMSTLKFDALLSKKIEENNREVIDLYREIKKLSEEAIKELVYEFDSSMEQLESLADMINTQITMNDTNRKLNDSIEKLDISKEEFKLLLASAMQKQNK